MSVGGEVSLPVMGLDSLAIELHFDFAELPIRRFVVGVISQRVVGRTFGDAQSDGAIDVVAVVESPAAGLAGQFVHAVVRGTQLRAAFLNRLYSARTAPGSRHPRTALGGIG